VDKRRVEMLRLRQEIVAAAGALFARSGYEATTFSRVARAIGRPKSAIGYHLFPSKASLAEAVLWEDDLRWRTAEDALEREGVPLGVERLLSLFLLSAREIAAHPERAGATRLLVELPALDIAATSTGRSLAAFDRVRFTAACIAADVAPGRREGRAETEAVADLFLDSTRGLILCDLAAKGEASLEPRLCVLWTSLLDAAGVPGAASIVRGVRSSPRVAAIAERVDAEMAERGTAVG
jgi:AcrR family transcriptional regulator